MSDASKLAARLAARQNQSDHQRRAAEKDRKRKEIARLRPLANQVRRELKRTDYPTEGPNGPHGLSYCSITIDGQEIPAWRLRLRIRDEDRHYEFGNDYITFDGRLVYFWRQLVSGDPKNSSGSPCVYRPRASWLDDEVHGHHGTYAISAHPEVVRLGLDYLLETLRAM